MSSGVETSEGQAGLRTFIDGKPDGPTIVFVHGWPDDHALWDKQVSVIVPHCYDAIYAHALGIRDFTSAVACRITAKYETLDRNEANGFYSYNNSNNKQHKTGHVISGLLLE